MAIWLLKNPANTIVRIPSDKNYYPTKVEIRDRCGNPIRTRSLYNEELDQDEPFILFAEVKSNNPNFIFPMTLEGTVTFCSNKEICSLNWKEGEPGRAKYESDPQTATAISEGCLDNNWHNLSFELDYKNSPKYYCGAMNIRFALESIDYENNFLLSGGGDQAVCCPWGSMLTLGTTVEVTSHDRPFPCEHLDAEMILAGDLNFHSMGEIRQGQFTTVPDELFYTITPPYHHPGLDLNFRLKIEGGPQRTFSSCNQHITVHHGFDAYQITLTGDIETAPDGVPVIAYDAQNIYAHAMINPGLATQDRIHYIWHVSSSNGGLAICQSDPHSRDTHIIPQQPGEIQIYCTVDDIQSSTEDNTPPITIRLKPEITITPLEDNRFCFDDANPGVLTIGPCHAATGNEALDELIEWDITEIVGSILATVPDPPVGPDVTFIFTGLPQDNSQFGQKTITASLPLYSSEGQLAIRIFFEKGATNNSGGGLPNWYYYWRQEYGPVPELMNTIFGGSAGGKAGDYNQFSDVITIYTAAAEKCPEFTVGGGIIFYEKSGVDNARRAVLHEFDHRAEIRKWMAGHEWYNQYGDHWLWHPNCEYGPLENPNNPACITNTNDSDSDGFPNDYEIQLNSDYAINLSRYFPDSYDMSLHFPGERGYLYMGDMEFMAFYRTNVAEAPDELDWSKGTCSKQWEDGGCDAPAN